MSKKPLEEMYNLHEISRKSMEAQPKSAHRFLIPIWVILLTSIVLIFLFDEYFIVIAVIGFFLLLAAFVFAQSKHIKLREEAMGKDIDTSSDSESLASQNRNE